MSQFEIINAGTPDTCKILYEGKQLDTDITRIDITVTSLRTTAKFHCDWGVIIESVKLEKDQVGLHALAMVKLNNIFKLASLNQLENLRSLIEMELKKAKAAAAKNEE